MAPRLRSRPLPMRAAAVPFGGSLVMHGLVVVALAGFGSWWLHDVEPPAQPPEIAVAAQEERPEWESVPRDAIAVVPPRDPSTEWVEVPLEPLERLAEVEMLMPRPPSPPLPQEWLRAPARTPRQPEPFGVVPADPAPAPAPSIPVRAALEPPQVDLTRCPEPNYPRAARRLGQQGVVEVLVTVDAEGLPTSVEAHLSSGFSLLDHAAVRAVEAWRFHPARDAEGAAVSGEIVVPVRFRLGGER